MRFTNAKQDVGGSSPKLQALIVVVIVSLASGIGKLLSADAGILDALVFGVVGGILSWAVWAFLVMFVGTKILKTDQTEADWGQLARGTGFAQTPGILNLFSFVPIVEWARLSYLWRPSGDSPQWSLLCGNASTTPLRYAHSSQSSWHSSR